MAGRIAARRGEKRRELKGTEKGGEQSRKWVPYSH